VFEKTKNTPWLVSNRIATLGAASDFLGVSERNCQRPRAGDGTTLFVALWEFEVKSGCEEKFEEVYGPSGAWARLFAQDMAYKGTRLVKDVERERVYLTLDFWETREAYEAFKNVHAEEYERIDKECEGMTVREKKLGDSED
jgi:heme-degrading monooxygenase HmoA